ncbi:unnamed protein product [Ceutorhynchus assimilis]|uniref:(+)RNA virus helicase C-terminal domain-containing protein n=1 Tax=Ceutorhynchus assimilis TaxID=467358 RepID=A0A9N9QLJ7_9CUCU|nr:unnamed protein product [Ceutorhynchus assimilis]
MSDATISESENFFCKVRSLGVCNNNPTCSQFAQYNISLIIDNSMGTHLPEANCEDEGCEVAPDNLISFISSPFEEQVVALNFPECETLQYDLRNIELTQLHHTIAGLLQKKGICPKCRSKLISDNLDPENRLIEKHGIETGTMKDLSAELIRELIPKIGIRAKFLKKFENYTNPQQLETPNVLQIGNANYQMIDLNDSILASLSPLTSTNIEMCSSSASSNISSAENLPSMPSQNVNQVLSTAVNTPSPSSSNQNMKTLKETGLKDLLISTTRGKLVMFSYKKNGKLLPEFRDKLVDLMLDAELEEHMDKKVSILRFQEMAAAIIALFPGECQVKSDENDENMQEAVDWLKHNIQPYLQLESRWRQTCQKRRTLLKNTPIDQYLKLFPILQTNEGYNMFNIDFEELYKQNDIFYLKWTSFSFKIFEYAKSNCNDKAVQDLVKQIESGILTEDGRNMRILKMMPYMMTPVTITRKWKPSKLEIEEAFILYIKSLDDLQVAIENRKIKLDKLKLNFQPKPIFIGSDLDNITSSYVRVDETLYLVESLLKAIEVTFKAIHALNASLRSFRNHCSLKHTESNQNVASCIAKDGPSVEYEAQDAAKEEFFKENEPDENNLDSFKLHFNNELLLFISKLYSLSHLPKTYIQLIINYLSELFGTLETLEKILTDNLTMPHHFKTSILSIFSLFKNPFESYKSEYLRVKEMESTENFIKPITYNIGECLTDVRSKQNILYKSVGVTAQFIPLRVQLKKFFENRTFYSAIQNYLEHIDQQQLGMSNIMQSALWTEIKRNFTGKTVFPLLLYYDDYETGNALGSHAGVHKLGAIYISLPCLPPQYSSKLNNIFLALLFHANDRKDFGNRAVLKILLDELSFLESNGIQICTGTKTEKIYFALALVLGDNLGMNSILGFNESFVANYFCRICKMSKDDTFFSCSQDSLLLRNSLNYEHDLVEIQDNSKTGIKEECVFHVLNNYNLTKNISVDPMHDLLEVHVPDAAIMLMIRNNMNNYPNLFDDLTAVIPPQLSVWTNSEHYKFRPVYLLDGGKINYARNSMIEQLELWRFSQKAYERRHYEVYKRLRLDYPPFIKELREMTENFCVVDRRTGKWLIRPTYKRKEYMYAFDGEKLLTVKKLENDYGYVPETISKTGGEYLLMSNDTELMLDDRLHEVCRNFDIVNFTPPVVQLTQSVPGCGKTHYILKTHKGLKQGQELKYDHAGRIENVDLILTSTKEAADDLKSRSIKESYTGDRKYYRTTHSYLLNSRDIFRTVYVDDALMRHPGELMFICALSGCARMVLLGDKNQIPYVNRRCLDSTHMILSTSVKY